MSEAAVFDELISEFYKVWFRYHPIAAIFAGVSGYEGLLAADGDDDVGALASWLGNLMVGLQELDYQALDADRQLDLRLIFDTVAIEHRTLLEHDCRHRDPARYLPLRALQELVVRQPEHFCEAMRGLLESTPNCLRRARGRLAELPETVSSLWLADALEGIDTGLPWLRQLGGELPQTRECCAEQGRMQALLGEVVEAIADYREFLVKALAPRVAGTADCGSELVEHLLLHRHQLKLTSEDALHMARLVQARIQQQLEEQGMQTDRLGEQLAELPRLQGEARLRAYREESDRLKAFVIEQGLLVPPHQPLELRQIAGYYSPHECTSYMRSEHGGVFLIPAGDDTPLAEGLAEIRLRLLYGGWAGRHFLTWSGGVEGYSLVRQINPSAAFKRGWAHYLSHLLEARDYFDEADLRLLAFRRLALAEQAVVDLEYHLGRIDARRALARLQGLSETPGWAESSLTALARRPTDAFMALLGNAMIQTTRRVVGERQPTLGPSQFHSQLLAHGAVSLPLVVRRVYGDEVWQRVSDEVLT